MARPDDQQPGSFTTGGRRVPARAPKATSQSKEAALRATNASLEDQDSGMIPTMGRSTLPKVAHKFKVKAVGVTFSDDYPKNLYRIKDRLENTPGGLIPAQLVREPDNEYDSNAVAVHIDGETIGHLPAPVAAKIAPHLDDNEPWHATVTDILITPGEEHQPGMNLSVRRTEVRSELYDTPIKEPADVVRLSALELGISRETIKAEANEILGVLQKGEKRSYEDSQRLWTHLVAKYAPEG